MASGIMRPLTSRINRPVTFNPPRDKAKQGAPPSHGTIIDKTRADPSINRSPPHKRPCTNGPGCWGDYSFFAQLTRWDHGQHSIRLGYYRRPCGEDVWRFASQTTVTAEWWKIKPLLRRTLAKAGWFRERPKLG